MLKKPTWRGLFEPLETRLLLSGNRVWEPDAAPLGDRPLEIDLPTAIVVPQRDVVARSYERSVSGAVPPAGGTDRVDAYKPPVVAGAEPVDRVVKLSAVPRTLSNPVAPRVAIDRVSSATIDRSAGKERPASDRRAGVTPIRLVTDIKTRTIVSSVPTWNRLIRPTVVKSVSDRSVSNAALRSVDGIKTIRTRLAAVLDKVSPPIKRLSQDDAGRSPRIDVDAAITPQVGSHPTLRDIPTAVTNPPTPGSGSFDLWWTPDATSHADDVAVGDEVETAVYDEAQSPAVSVPVRTTAADRHASTWSSRSVRGVNMADAGADEEPLIAHRMETVTDAADRALTEERSNSARTAQTAGALLAVTFGNPLTRLIGAMSAAEGAGSDAPLALAPIPPTPSRRRRRARKGKRQTTEETSTDQSPDASTSAAKATAEAAPAVAMWAAGVIADEAPRPPKRSAISPQAADRAFGTLGQRLIGTGQIRQVNHRTGRASAELATWNGTTAWQLGVGSLLGSIGWLALERCRSAQSSRNPARPTRLACTGPTHDGPLAVG
ncbi:MAG: hypothetical protein ACC645_07575 [Pirellulales bacterium]